jgi:hypothetical protein
MMLEELRRIWHGRVRKYNLEKRRADITMHPLKPEEAVGKPSRDGYALMKGREVIIEARVGGAIGRAFTDEPSEYTGSLDQFTTLPLDGNGARGRVIAVINATYRFLGLVGGTKHCRDDGPEHCGAKIVDYLVRIHAPDSRLLVIGFQSAIAYYMSRKFRNVQVTDMDNDNIGRSIHGLTIESSEGNKAIIESSNLILATGSSLVNGSVDDIVKWSSGKTLYFYGVTVAAATYEFNLNRLCFAAL